jgi:hypothetical protein
MKKFALALVAVAVTSAHANQTWTPVREDLDVSFNVEEIATPTEALEQIERMRREESSRDIGQGIVIIEKIINLGQKIWKIIEDNQAVSEVQHKYANALPAGVRGPEELDGFSPMQHRSYRMYGKNWYGMTVYDVTYTLVHRYGGSYQGRGKYLDGVTVLPNHVSTLWGYTLSMGVDNVSTVNVGTRENPVGSIMMQMTFKVGTVIKKSEYRGLYEFRGDSRTVATIED